VPALLVVGVLTDDPGDHRAVTGRIAHVPSTCDEVVASHDPTRTEVRLQATGGLRFDSRVEHSHRHTARARASRSDQACPTLRSIDSRTRQEVPLRLPPVARPACAGIVGERLACARGGGGMRRPERGRPEPRDRGSGARRRGEPQPERGAEKHNTISSDTTSALYHSYYHAGLGGSGHFYDLARNYCHVDNSLAYDAFPGGGTWDNRFSSYSNS
jgi:hypothetical protein